MPPRIAVITSTEIILMSAILGSFAQEGSKQQTAGFESKIGLESNERSSSHLSRFLTVSSSLEVQILRHFYDM